jgi:hypothetical protein
MYFKDLFEEKGPYDIIRVKVGWLDSSQPFELGVVPYSFVDKLKELKPVIRTRGWHDCPFCHRAKSSNQFLIEVPGRGNKVMYDVPEMIIHYIEEHNYVPPREFINAIINL